ncbi:MAG: hypothetical protein R3F54_08515 [Alphaproteobacteria bacterium]
MADDARQSPTRQRDDRHSFRRRNNRHPGETADGKDDLKAADGKQDSLTIEQARRGKFEMPDWDPVSPTRPRDVLKTLAAMILSLRDRPGPLSAPLLSLRRNRR